MKWLLRLGSRISIRLLAFNLLLVFLPAGAVLYFDALERLLLRAQEQVMVQQGRVLAAALSERGVLKAAYAEGILVRLRGQTEARMRVVDPEGRLLADTALLASLKEPQEEESDPEAALPRASFIYRLGALLFRGYQKLFEPSPPLAEPEGEDVTLPELVVGAPPPTAGGLRAPGILASPEVRKALWGQYGSRTTISPGGERSAMLYSALPIWDGDQVVGAVQVSQSTYRVLRAIYPIRLGIFRVFLASVVAAVVLSLLVSGTIARPLRRLRDEANAILDRRGRLKGRFRGTKRLDEIGELSRGLEELSRRLEEHVRFIESFAADLSHEVKNPLASIRSAVEMAAEVSSEEERKRFFGIVAREVHRMEHLLAGAKELAQVDARLETEERSSVEISGLLGSIVEGYRLRRGADVKLDLVPSSDPIVVRASPERLTQVFENILDNAVSFSPERGTVRIVVSCEDKRAHVEISDEGPGLAQGSESAIFTRFYSYRPGKTKSDDGHTGLGLALVKAIVEGYGGSVTAQNRGRGASFSVGLPLSEH